MAHNPTKSTALRNAELDCTTSAIGSSGLLRIYDGSQPAGPGTAITTQTLLSEHALSATFAGGASSGTLTANAIADATAAATGTAAWFRLCKSDGTGVRDGTVGTSGCDLTIDNTSINSGQTVSVTSLTIS